MPADLRNTSLQDRIAPIAVGLGAGWAALLDDRDGEAYLAGPDGERLRVTSDGARLCFRGDLGDAGPHGYGLDNPRACVSASKAPSTIAKDVARRILPKYRAALAEARRRKTESDAADHRRDALVAAIADALGPSVGEVWLDHCGRAHLQLGDYALHEDDVEAQFEIGSGRHPARVTLQVSKDLVVALAAAVDALARQGRCNHDPAALTEVPANRCECGELLPCLADEPAETLPGPAG